MKFLFILIVLSSSTLNAQSQFVKLDFVSWDELKMLQKDHLLTVEELKLETDCPSTVNEVRENYRLNKFSNQTILGTIYFWREYVDDFDRICIVRNINSYSTKAIYEVLEVDEAQTLLSASRKHGAPLKALHQIDYKELGKKLFLQNQNIVNIKSEIYGGIDRMTRYSKGLIPERDDIDYKSFLELYFDDEMNAVTHLPVDLLYFKWFEHAYSNRQKDELIQRVKNPNYSEQQEKLLNKYWFVSSYKTQSSEKKKVFAKNKFHFYFDRNTLGINGKLGCRNFRGFFEFQKDTIKIMQGLETSVHCNYDNRITQYQMSQMISKKEIKRPSADLVKEVRENNRKFEQENKIIKKLIAKVKYYYIDNGVLTLSTKNGEFLILH